MYTQTAWQAAEARFAEMRDVMIVVPHLKKSLNEAHEGVAIPDTRYTARYLLECG